MRVCLNSDTGYVRGSTCRQRQLTWRLIWRLSSSGVAAGLSSRTEITAAAVTTSVVKSTAVPWLGRFDCSFRSTVVRNNGVCSGASHKNQLALPVGADIANGEDGGPESGDSCTHSDQHRDNNGSSGRSCYYGALLKLGRGNTDLKKAKSTYRQIQRAIARRIDRYPDGEPSPSWPRSGERTANAGQLNARLQRTTGASSSNSNSSSKVRNSCVRVGTKRGGIYQFHREPTDRPIGWRSLLPAWIEWFNHHKPFGWISQRAIDEGDEVACRSIALPASETAWNLAVSIMAIKGKKSSTKSPPIFSNEFIIQNHADIVSCVAMVFVIGFFVNVTQPYAAPFVTLQHNITELHASQVFYSSGIRDLCLIFFTTLIMIVLHAVLQEYVLDKLNRKVHLSKAKHAKFNASGQLATFYALSTLWAGSILNNDGLLPLSSLWAGFPGEPHNRMLFTEKLFFIAQIAYWLHMYAELYFERVKREEYVGRISVATAHVVLFLLAYGLNLWRVGLVLTFVHYLEQTLFHVARLAYFYGHSTSGKLFSVWNLVFIAARLVITSLSFLVFRSGLPASMFTLRVAGLSLIGATQLYMVFAFLSFHIGRIRAYRAATQKFSKGKNGKEGKIKGAKSASIVDKSLPEADQGQGPPSPIVAKDDAKLGSLKDSNVKKRLKARA